MAHGMASVAKASATLAALAHQVLALPPHARLLAYKTHIRSQLNYGTPVAFALARANPRQPSSVRLMEALEKFHLQSLGWIFGTRTPRAVLESLSALGPATRYLEEMCAGLALQLRPGHLCPHNPLHQLLTHHPMFQGPAFQYEGLVLPHLRQAPLLTAWLALPDADRPTWSAFRRQERVRLLTAGAPGALTLYILASCRSPTSAIDTCLAIRDAETRRRALAWRRNKSFLNLPCPVCHQRFNRRHVMECELLTFHPALTTATITSFNLAAQTPTLVNTNYCYLDHALNTQDHDTFATLYQALKNQFQT